jgi:hypothetical protein
MFVAYIIVTTLAAAATSTRPQVTSAVAWIEVAIAALFLIGPARCTDGEADACDPPSFGQCEDDRLRAA